MQRATTLSEIKTLSSTLSKLYETDGPDYMDKVYNYKITLPISNWTWYPSEFLVEEPDEDNDEENLLYFGLVDGFDLELGYFTLNEMMEFNPVMEKIEPITHRQIQAAK